MISWTDDAPLEGELEIAQRELADLEWEEQVEAWETEDRDRVEAHE